MTTKSPVDSAREFLESDRSLSFAQSVEFRKLIYYAESLEREIEILRLYGNKDCTAMADERLEELRGSHGLG